MPENYHHEVGNSTPIVGKPRLCLVAYLPVSVSQWDDKDMAKCQTNQAIGLGGYNSQILGNMTCHFVHVNGSTEHFLYFLMYTVYHICFFLTK